MVEGKQDEVFHGEDSKLSLLWFPVHWSPLKSRKWPLAAADRVSVSHCGIPFGNLPASIMKLSPLQPQQLSPLCI
jgi:hypothetical protein